ncbi:carboxypeptidase-like regulatory domain-containing protein [Flavobacterium sp.]|jgi:hypothetical protein|uniref:carboxypeptidase-like regulatory domain-containing protein n=1 Tax=Flavobacterium sp. TaxID=239 RepID=UPI0037C0C74E
MKNLVYFLFLMLSCGTWAQTDTTTIKIKAKIINSSSKKEIAGVTVINKTKTITTVSDDHGNFEIVASLNDVLFFSHLAYEHTKVEVSSTWMQAKIKTITLLEKVNEIEPILISHLLLTGYLQIDTKLIPINENKRFNIAGLNLGYEPGMKAPKATQNLINALTNPVDLVYSLFNTKKKDMDKLLEIKKDENFKKLLSQQSDREAIAMLLQMDKAEIAKILEKCNYSKVFIDTASDLQVLDALATAYSDYQVLKGK